MSDSDDDMPPPLEDMSAHVEAMQARKQKNTTGPLKSNLAASAQDDDDGEEIRLVPKKQQPSRIAMTPDDTPASSSTP